jgi:hypothetical protein
MMNSWNVWLMAGLMLLYSLIIVVSYYDGKKDNPYVLFMFVWIFTIIFHGVTRLYRMDHLPVGRRTLFAHAFLPIIIAGILGVASGRIIVATDDHGMSMVNFYRGTVQYPDEFYEISTDGPPAVLTSPWGETHRPRAHQLLKGSRIYVYRPYDCGSESSHRFIAYQIRRALEAVHGRDDYEVMGESDIERCCRHGFTVDASLGRGSDARSRAFAVGTIAAGILYTLIIWLQFRFGGRAASWHTPKHFVLAALGTVVLLFIAVVVCGRLGYCEPRFVGALLPIMMRKTGEAIPLGTNALWAAAALVIAGGYLTVQSAFCRIEAFIGRPNPVVKYY